MAVSTRWINGDPSILIHTFTGTWSSPEVEGEIQAETPEILSRSEKVVVIIDILQYSMPTRNINIFPMLRRFITNQRPPQIQTIIIVMRDSFAYSLMNLARKIIPRSDVVVTAKSMDEALALVEKLAQAS